MHMDDDEILQYYSETRNLKKNTILQIELYLKEYSTYFSLTLQELLTEAENEEEKGIRWKHRRLKKRLLEYRNYLFKKHAYSTAKVRFRNILSFYRHFEIEIHNLPSYSAKNDDTVKVSFRDLPDKEIIKKALNISSPLMRAVILFMSSSGCARTETLNLTVNDFIEATKEYHHANDLNTVLGVLKNRDDVVPTFYLKRQKTNKHYYCFCSPEATTAIVDYLVSREKKSEKLFDITPHYFVNIFGKINNKLHLGKIGYYNRFRSHMLRKFNASQLYNDGMPLEMVDALQGRSKNTTHTSYFMEDPKKLKQIYIEHMDAITINMDVSSLDIKSDEYIALESENKQLTSHIDDQKKTINSVLRRLEQLERKKG